MKRSLGILGIAALAFSLSGCGGSDNHRESSEWKAAYAECESGILAGVKEYNDTPGIEPMSTPDVAAVCEPQADVAVGILPSGDTTPAGAVDEECLREWAENALKPDSMITGFEGMTVDEVMQDPMAQFACE